MKKVINQIKDIFEKYNCYSLYDLEEISDSFGCGDGDKYYYSDLTFTKHSLDGDFCCFMSLHLKPVDLDKAIFKLEINKDLPHYTLSFRNESLLLQAVEEVKKCKELEEALNKDLEQIKVFNEDEEE